MRILLVLASPDNDPLRGRHPFMPLSLPILASVAPEHEYYFHDMLWEKSYPDYNLDVEIVGISYRISGEKTAFEIADKYRKQGKCVVLGGPQPTMVPFSAKQHANSVVVGEGELLWPKVLEDFANNALKDFYVSPPNQISNPDYAVYSLPYLPNIEKYPIPDRSRFKHKYKFDMVYASKGCPINCDFCVVTDIYGNKCRHRLIEDVVEEIATLNKFFYLIDETVFGRANNHDYYLNLYKKLSEIKPKRYWTGQGSLDAASNEIGKKVIEQASISGLTYVAIGIESINKSSLISSGSFAKSGIKSKDDHLKALETNIHLIQDSGLSISGWFAIGYDTDSLQTYFATVDFCIKNHIFPVITPVHALPGSRLYKKLETKNMLQSSQENITNVKHSQITNNEILLGMRYNLHTGYSFKRLLKNTIFYFKIFVKSESSINDIIYKTIFTFVTQRKMKKILRWEIKRMEETIG